MNRETKRMTDRRGRADDVDVADLGEAVTVPARERRVATPRTGPMQFLREVRDELRQVAWPSRAELINYTAVVFFTLVIMISLIFLLNYAFGKGVLFMFQK